MNECMCNEVGVIVQYTTPTIKIRFCTVDPADITEAYLVFKYAGVNLLEKDISDAVVDTDEKTIAWTLTQRDSALLTVNTTVRVYCDWLLMDGTRGRSKFADFKVVETGMSEVI